MMVYIKRQYTQRYMFKLCIQPFCQPQTPYSNHHRYIHSHIEYTICYIFCSHIHLHIYNSDLHFQSHAHHHYRFEFLVNVIHFLFPPLPSSSTLNNFHSLNIFFILLPLTFGFCISLLLWLSHI